MSKLAIFYHARLVDGDPPVDHAHALSIMAEQMQTLSMVGLLGESSHTMIGLNGGTESFTAAKSFIPPSATTILHGLDRNSELPTLSHLQHWLPGHEDWNVLYLNSKGAKHPGCKFNRDWRRCMENVVLHNWRTCVADLDAGVDSVGAHWLTNEKHGAFIHTPYWAGNFWWAKASFLATLPELPVNATCHRDHYLAESWIGRGQKIPTIKDYAPHWPHHELCAEQKLITDEH